LKLASTPLKSLSNINGPVIVSPVILTLLLERSAISVSFDDMLAELVDMLLVLVDMLLVLVDMLLVLVDILVELVDMLVELLDILYVLVDMAAA
jgi:hypothetical protein